MSFIAHSSIKNTVDDSDNEDKPANLNIRAIPRPEVPHPDNSMINMSTVMSIAEFQQLSNMNTMDGQSEGEDMVELIEASVDHELDAITHEASAILEELSMMQEVREEPRPEYPKSDFVDDLVKNSQPLRQTLDKKRMTMISRIVDPRIKERILSASVDQRENRAPQIRPIINSTKLLQKRLEKACLEKFDRKIVETRIPQAVFQARRAAAKATTNFRDNDIMYEIKNDEKSPIVSDLAIPRAKKSVSKNWKKSLELRPCFEEFFVPEWKIDLTSRRPIPELELEFESLLKCPKEIMFEELIKKK